LLGGWVGDWVRQRFRSSYLVSGIGFSWRFQLRWRCSTRFHAPGVLFIAVFFFNTVRANAALANTTPPFVRSTAFALNILIIHAFGDAISPARSDGLPDTNMNVAFQLVSEPWSSERVLADRRTLSLARHRRRRARPRRKRLNRVSLPSLHLRIEAASFYRTRGRHGLDRPTSRRILSAVADVLTPMMQQHQGIGEAFPGHPPPLSPGDFYEMFFEVEKRLDSQVWR
jgi:hypothetical protein